MTGIAAWCKCIYEYHVLPKWHEAIVVTVDDEKWGGICLDMRDGIGLNCGSGTSLNGATESLVDTLRWHCGHLENLTNKK